MESAIGFGIDEKKREVRRKNEEKMVDYHDKSFASCHFLLSFYEAVYWLCENDGTAANLFFPQK